MSRIINDNGVNRQMTTAEEAAHDAAIQQIVADADAQKDALTQAAVSLASAREKLTALGLTQAEIRALVGQ